MHSSAAGTRNLSELRTLLPVGQVQLSDGQGGSAVGWKWKLGDPEVRIERLPVNRVVESTEPFVWARISNRDAVLRVVVQGTLRNALAVGSELPVS